MFKTELPRLPNGEIDFSQVDPSNDFRLFPKIFSTPEDIYDFIIKESLELPFLRELLELFLLVW